MVALITTLGPQNADELGMILPHEHLYVSLRILEDDIPEAEAADVVALMGPEVEKIKAQGVTALVECTPHGVGRRVDMDLAVSQATQFPVIVPTGIYREPWVPPWAQEASEDAIYEWMLGELTGTIEDTGVQAAWIKLSAGDDGLTDCERKILRAGARAGQATGAIIGSHTIKGRVVRDQLDEIEASGYTAERFIWIHTQAEPDFSLHLEMARRGAWIEYDWIGGSPDDAVYIDHIQRLIEAGFGEHILLSQDRGWYDPGTPERQPKPFTYLVETFLPKLRAAGFDEAMIRQLTQDNPFHAFAR